MASFYFLSYSAEVDIWQCFSRGYISGTLHTESSTSLLCPSVIRLLMFSFNTRGVFTLTVVSSQTNPETLSSPDWQLLSSLDSLCFGHSAFPARRHDPRGEREPWWVTKVYAALYIPLTFMYVYVPSQRAHTEVRIRSISVFTWLQLNRTLRLTSWDKKKPKHLVQL